MLFSDSFVTNLLGIAVALIVIVISFFKWKYSRFSRLNLPYLEPTIPNGNLPSSVVKRTEPICTTIKRFYDEMKSKGWAHGGVFFMTSPIYIILDTEMLKNVLTKDFSHFVDRGIYYNEKDDPISAHLFALGGTKWRNLRVKLTPTFTSGKMKSMFQTLLDCETNLLDKIELDYKNKSPIDIKEVLGCFTTDIIGSCAFGLECNSFQDEDSLFRKYGKQVFTSTLRGRLHALVFTNFPNLARSLGIRIVAKDVSAFFTKVVTDTVEYRERNNQKRKDFLQLLIDLKNNKLAEEEGYKHDGQTLTIEEITAQSFLFFLAGFETSSTLMSWTLYELAKHQDIQERVREEIVAVLKKHNGEVTYDGIQELKYMTQVFNESLRKYPPLPFVTRVCVKDYKIPGEDRVLPKGLRILIPIMAIHHDEEYYPDPERFDPERFNDENSAGRNQYTHIPFGEGPRICIGLRFGLMQAKVGMISLLSRYKFTLNEKTKQPMKYNVNGFIPSADGGIWLNAEKL